MQRLVGPRQASMSQLIPLQRLGYKTEIAEASCFICSKRSVMLCHRSNCDGFIVHVYPPLMRKRIVSLSFGKDVRTCLEVVISKVSAPPVFYIKVGAYPLCALPKDSTGKLAGLFSTTLLKCQHQAGKL